MHQSSMEPFLRQAYPQIELINFSEKIPYAFIVPAVVQQQETSVSRCHKGGDYQVVEAVHCLC